MTLGGLLKHLAHVEDLWFSRVNVRWIMVHVIEEYARHNGHADLLGEAVDGQTSASRAAQHRPVRTRSRGESRLDEREG